MSPKSSEKYLKYIKLKRKVSHIFSLLIAITYFSIFLIIGFTPNLLARKINDTSMTLGIAFGLCIIVFSIFLTLIYTVISNKYLDQLKQ